jgi:predicted branched-subunit amino acid permease
MLFYLAWQAGTLLGVAGAQAVALEDLAAAVFPVLFIGLAAITATGRSGALRAVATAAIVLLGTVLAPGLHPFLPIVAALLVALPGPGRR